VGVLIADVTAHDVETHVTPVEHDDAPLVSLPSQKQPVERLAVLVARLVDLVGRLAWVCAYSGTRRSAPSSTTSHSLVHCDTTGAYESPRRDPSEAPDQSVAYMPHICNSRQMARMAPPTRTAADAAAIDALVPSNDRASYEAKVAALLARNTMLDLIEKQRGERQMSKKELAERAGLEASAVRRLLTAKTANPTSENMFRLMGALDIHLEAVTPSGKRVSLV
jgi:hypothetical protein